MRRDEEDEDEDEEEDEDDVSRTSSDSRARAREDACVDSRRGRDDARWTFSTRDEAMRS